MSTPNPNMRLSNAEREALIAKLHAATEEGRLELAEFDERSREVYEAKTYRDVERLLEDLPDSSGQLVGPEGVSPEARRAEAAPTELRIAPSYSSDHRRGAWLVPEKIDVSGTMSSVKLDFTSAVIRSREVRINVRGSGSSLELILPEDAYAEANVDLTLSSLKNRCEFGGADGVRFKVTGKINLGSVKVRRQYRFLWWRW